MSQENVDRLLEVTESFNRLGESADSITEEALVGFLGFLDPEIVFEPVQALLEGTYLGRDGVVAWLVDLAEHYQGGGMHYADVRDLGDRVLGLGTLRVTGKTSGIEIDVPLAVVATFEDGLITHLKDYGDRGQALAAVGLLE